MRLAQRPVIQRPDPGDRRRRDVVLVGMVGLVIDVGMQWGGQPWLAERLGRLGEAGAVVLMEYMLGATHDDADVLDAVEDAASAGEIDVELAEYTDWQGVPFDPSIEVGSGGPIRPGRRASASSERASTRPCSAAVLGVNELTVHTDATAFGPRRSPARRAAACALLPVTVPTTIVTCDGQNKSVATEDPWLGPPGGPEYIIPLCGTIPVASAGSLVAAGRRGDRAGWPDLRTGPARPVLPRLVLRHIRRQCELRTCPDLLRTVDRQRHPDPALRGHVSDRPR